MNNKERGMLGEKVAVNYLKKNNYNILEKNYKNKLGEIDIIAEKDDIIIFIEVKARTSNKFGFPYEAVDNRKRKKIINTALAYIKFKMLKEIQFRFDIIEVYLNKPFKIKHIKNAFWV